MDSWLQKARDFAQEAARKSQELAMEAAKLSQEIATETAKKSKEIAVEASKKADQIKIEASKKADQLKTEASKRADQFKSFTIAGENFPSAAKKSESGAIHPPEELQIYGVTDELREFVKGLTLDTFKDFPLDNFLLEDYQAREQEATPSSNIRQDLTKWQERHAVIVLSIVPEISHFRYVLCPRHMKESKFWKIYFMLVKSHVAPYEMHYMQQLKAAAAEQDRSIRLQDNLGTASSEVEMVAATGSTKAKVAPTENDIDAFLLGDLGSSDEDGDEGDDIFGEDFDQIVNSTGLDSDDEDGMTSNKPNKSEKTPTKPLVSDGSSDGELVEVPAEH